MAIHRIKGQQSGKDKRVTVNTPISDDALAQLAKIMNNSPSLLELHGTIWEIRGLKPAVQMLIAEEACKIVDKEKASMGDVLKSFSVNLGSIVRCLSLALLNDKCRIFKDYSRYEYSDEYHAVYDVLMWGDYTVRDWSQLLYEVLSLIDIDFFFESSSVVKTVRKMTLERKITRAEAE